MHSLGELQNKSSYFCFDLDFLTDFQSRPVYTDLPVFGAIAGQFFQGCFCPQHTVPEARKGRFLDPPDTRIKRTALFSAISHTQSFLVSPHRNLSPPTPNHPSVAS